MRARAAGFLGPVGSVSQALIRALCEPVSHLPRVTDREYLVASYLRLERMEERMSELQQSVEDLQGAVSDLGTRIGTQVGPLQEALAAAQQALTDFTAADTAEDADYQAQIDTLMATVSAKIQEAQDAAGQVETSVTDLNAMAQPAPE